MSDTIMKTPSPLTRRVRDRVRAEIRTFTSLFKNIEPPPQTAFAESQRIALEAKQVLETPGLVRAFAELEAQAVADWRAGKTVEEREAAHARLKVIEDVLTTLQRTVVTHAVDTFEEKMRHPNE